MTWTAVRPTAQRCVLLLIGIVASALPAGAAELGLTEAMELARENAREVAVGQARLEASQARERLARSRLLPTVSIEEIGIHTDSPAEAFGLSLNQKRFSFQKFVAGDPNNPDSIDSFTTRLELSLPVYMGGGLSARIRQAEHGVQASEKTLERTSDLAALAAAQAYVRLAQVRERVVLLERSLETIRAHVSLARAYVDEGLLVRSEVLRADVERSRVKDLLVEARGQSRIAEAYLSFTLGLELGRSWELEPLPKPSPLPQEPEALLHSAKSRSDLQSERAMVKIAEEEARARHAQRLPRVSFIARKDLVDDHPFGGHGDSTTIMAVGSIDLFAGGRHRAAVDAARAEAKAAARESEHLDRGVALAVRSAFEAATTASEREQTALGSLDAAREALRIIRERFERGVVKTLDLLDAQNALREAETRELVARAEALLATFTFAVEAGLAPETVVGNQANGSLVSDPAEPLQKGTSP